MKAMPVAKGTIIFAVRRDDFVVLAADQMWSGGKCQYIPNSFVPVHPEQGKGYN